MPQGKRTVLAHGVSVMTLRDTRIQMPEAKREADVGRAFLFFAYRFPVKIGTMFAKTSREA